MSDKPKNSPAFPVIAGQNVYTHGMTLRDYFAGQALAGAMEWCRYAATKEGNSEMAQPKKVVGFSYAIADAMLAERET